MNTAHAETIAVPIAYTTGEQPAPDSHSAYGGTTDNSGAPRPIDPPVGSWPRPFPPPGIDPPVGSWPRQVYPPRIDPPVGSWPRRGYKHAHGKHGAWIPDPNAPAPPVHEPPHEPPPRWWTHL